MEYDKHMDKECIRLCDAINSIPGIRAIESCSGHGKKEYSIYFYVENYRLFSILLYYSDPCHVGFEWPCKARTDCSMSPVSFRLHSLEVGDLAYKQADRIAKEIENFMENEFDSFLKDKSIRLEK